MDIRKRMRNIYLLTGFFILLVSCDQKTNTDLYVEGVFAPVVNLNGTWKINLSPSEHFTNPDFKEEGWRDIQVPGECMMQGFPIHHDVPFVYGKRITIPADFDGKTILLRFDGVYSYARVWINGHFIRDHSGGFTHWNCNITPYVKPGEKALITVEVTDKRDEISDGSGYTRHLIGGILRDVSLLALPEIYPAKLTIRTNFDEQYENAMLTVRGILNEKVSKAEIRLTLKDPNGSEIALDHPLAALKNTEGFVLKNPVVLPQKWDAEHPNLYKLIVSCYENGKLLYRKMHVFGFREIEIAGKKILVNGTEVKLRGICRHDMHPLLGRVSTPEYERMDVELAKEANINFIRTSHYPPTENFLRLCDQYGIYVEEETAVCFVDTWRIKGYKPGATQDDPGYTKKYLSQLEEMVTNHCNHPSVIIWSIGNENKYGENFKKSYDWVKAADPTRPVMFSYPGHVPDSVRAYDVLSMHYPPLSGDKNEFGAVVRHFGSNKMPVIFDEMAHIACYNYPTIKKDENIRNFWGQSIDRMWSKLYDADGGAGGAIWGMIDETFMLPDTMPGFKKWWGIQEPAGGLQPYPGPTVGSGEWGIVDTWRRKKPEFWNVKKAYSPFKLLQTEFSAGQTKEVISLPVYNRFNHTNFSELKIKFTQDKITGWLKPVSVKPHQRGIINIPVHGLNPEQAIELDIYNISGRLIDCYSLKPKTPPKRVMHEKSREKVKVTEGSQSLTVSCRGGISIIIDKTTGKIRWLQRRDDTVRLMGPSLHLYTKGKPITFSLSEINKYGKDWQLKRFSYEFVDNDVVITVKGFDPQLSGVDYRIRISADGLVFVKYRIEKMPEEYIRELGVSFKLDDEFDSLSWIRDAYWTCYPESHLSSVRGKAALYSDILKRYREPPPKDWVFDAKSFFYDGVERERQGEAFTYIAKSTKENIKMYSLFKSGGRVLTVRGNGKVSCRIEKEAGGLMLFLNNELDYPDLSWGNYQRNILLPDHYTNEITVQIYAANNRGVR